MAWDADVPYDGDVEGNYPTLHRADKAILEAAINAGRVYIADTENDKPKTPGTIDTSFDDGMFCYVKDTDMFYFTDPAAWAGTATFTAGSPNVVGVGTAFATELEAGDQITWNAASTWYEIQSVTDANNLTLTSNVSGGAASSAFSVWKRCNLAPENLTAGTISSALTLSGANTFSGTNTFSGPTVQSGRLTLPTNFVSNPNTFAKTTTYFRAYYSGTTAVTINFDTLAVFSTSGGYVQLLERSNMTGVVVNFTGGTGAGYLDSGAVAANTLYYIWVIYNPTTGDANVMASTADKADSLTLPAGYTYVRLVSCCRTDATPNVIRFYQTDDMYHFYRAPLATVVSGVAFGAYPTKSADLITWVPGLATSAFVPKYLIFTVSSDAANPVYLGWDSTDANSWHTLCVNGGQVILPAGASWQYLYWGAAGGNVTIYLNGFHFPLDNFDMDTGYE